MEFRANVVHDCVDGGRLHDDVDFVVFGEDVVQEVLGEDLRDLRILEEVAQLQDVAVAGQQLDDDAVVGDLGV